MAHFKLIPLDGLMDCIEFDAVSAASVLEITIRSTLGESDVYCDGSYQCTISHGRSGVWIITQRKIGPRFGGSAASQAGEMFRVDPETRLFLPEMV